MKRIGLWAGAAITGILLLIFGGAAIYVSLYSISLSDIRSQIEDEMRAATGRKVKISGAISLAVSLVPSLTIEGLTIANEPWGKAAHLLSVRRMNVHVRLRPLFTGAVEIASFQVEGAVLHLEVDGSKRKNWNLSFSGNGGDAIIENIQFKNLTVDFRDVIFSQPQFSTLLDKVVLKIEKDEAAFELTGKLGEHAITADGHLAPFYSASNTPQRFDLRAKAFDSDLIAKGKAKFPFRDSHTDASFQFKAPNGPGKLLGYFGFIADNLEPLEASGKITGKGAILKLYGLKLEYGDINIGGEVIIGTVHTPLRLGMKLQSTILDIAPLVKAIGQSPSTSPGRLFSSDKFNLRLPTNVDFDLLYSVGEIRTGGDIPKNFFLDAQLRNGALNARRIEFDIYGGKSSSSISLTPQDKKYALSLQSLHNSLAFEQLAHLFGWPKITEGRTSILFEGKSLGDSLASLAAGLDGRFFMQLQQGRVPAKFSSMMSGDLIDVFKSFAAAISGNKNEPVECAIAAFDIVGGVAQAKSILLLTQQASVSGSGTVDLGRESLRLNLKPTPRNLSLVNLATEVRVRGNLIDPQFELNKSSVAKKVGVTALGFALGPIGAAIGPVTSVIRNAQKKSSAQLCAAANQAALSGLRDWPELRQLVGIPSN